MRAMPCNPGFEVRRPRGRAAFTLVELMTAVSVTAVLLTMTAIVLNQATSIWSKGKSSIDVFLEARASLDYLRQDIEGAITSKHLDLAPAPITAGGSPVHEESHKLAKRYFVPFEINRTLGEVFDGDYRFKPGEKSSAPLSDTKAFANAIGAEDDPETEYHHNFDALSMLTLSPMTRQVNTDIERGDYGGGSRGNRWNTTDEDLIGDGFSRNQGDVCLAGYYCAYTYDSPLPGARATVKLHRHFRDSGTWWNGLVSGDDGSGTRNEEEVQYRNFTVTGRDFDSNLDRRPVQSRAHVIVYKLANVAHPLYQQGLYANRDLPFLLKPVDSMGFGTDSGGGGGGTNTGGELLTIEPFPAHPSPSTPDNQGPDYAADTLVAPPQYPECYEAQERDDRTQQYFLFPDEPIAFNVVRFKATPLRREGTRLVKATSLNTLYSGYGLSANNAPAEDEWPVVLAPDVVDIELTIIDDATAAKFENYDDWTKWDEDGYRGGFLKGIVDENSRTFRSRIYVRSADWQLN